MGLAKRKPARQARDRNMRLGKADIQAKTGGSKSQDMTWRGEQEAREQA
jgi:hypothetical protein